jgi:hypothetical protein
MVCLLESRQWKVSIGTRQAKFGPQITPALVWTFNFFFFFCCGF